MADISKIKLPDITEALNIKDATARGGLESIENKIPTDASSTNKLVSADTMGDAIAAVEAKQLYKTNAQGSFATKAELTAATTFYDAAGNVATPTKNDVAYVLADEDHDGKSTKYVIASISGSTPVWGFVIAFSNVTFTQAQMATINSGMSSSDKTKLDGIEENANDYTHPTGGAASQASGFYKISTDSTSHVASVTAVVKSDITALGIPGADTNQTVKGDGTAFGSNAAVDIVAGNNITVTSDTSANTITIAATSGQSYSAGTGLSLSGTTFNHSNSVTAGTAGEGGSSRTLAFGGTFNVPNVSYDAQGHITTKGSTTLTMPANPNTHYTNAFNIQGNGTTATSFTQDSAKTLNIAPGSNVSVTAGTNSITIAATDTVASEVTFTFAANSATQTISVSGVTADTIGIVAVAQSATQAQYQAAAKAQLRCTAQASGTITMTAYGTTPTVAIPCVLTILKA